MMLPRIYIDETKAERLVQCLRRYRRGVPETTGEPGRVGAGFMAEAH